MSQKNNDKVRPSESPPAPEGGESTEEAPMVAPDLLVMLADMMYEGLRGVLYAREEERLVTMLDDLIMLNASARMMRREKVHVLVNMQAVELVAEVSRFFGEAGVEFPSALVDKGVDGAPLQWHF